MAEGSEEASTINLTVKTAKDKQQVEIPKDATVKQVKRYLGPRVVCHAVLCQLQKIPPRCLLVFYRILPPWPWVLGVWAWERGA